MAEEHTGGCVCGAVRYKAKGAPMRVTICHCLWCQRRTGTAFGTEVVFNDADVEFSGTVPTRYRHVSDESGRWLDVEFCPTCGSNLGFTLEAAPGVRGVPAGTFDDPSFLSPERQTVRQVFTPLAADMGGCDATRRDLRDAFPPMIARCFFLVAALLASLITAARAQGNAGCDIRRLVSLGPPIDTGGVRDYPIGRWPVEDHGSHITVMSGLAADGAQLKRLHDQIGDVIGRPMHIRHADTLEPGAALVIMASRAPDQLARSPMAIAFFGSAEAVRERFDGRPADSCFANSFHWQDGYSKIYKTFGFFPASAAGRDRQACHAQLVLASLGIRAPPEIVAGLLSERDDAMLLNERAVFLLRTIYTARPHELLRASTFFANRQAEFHR